jgi:hypothetical protein
VLLHLERLERREHVRDTYRSVGGFGVRRGWVRTERDPRIASDAGACRFDIFLIISGATRSMMPNNSDILR